MTTYDAVLDIFRTQITTAAEEGRPSRECVGRFANQGEPWPEWRERLNADLAPLGWGNAVSKQFRFNTEVGIKVERLEEVTA